MLTPEQHAARARKIDRLKAGATPRALELCSGCGGLSLGLSAAGFDLTAHIEIDPNSVFSLRPASAQSGFLLFFNKVNGAPEGIRTPGGAAPEVAHCGQRLPKPHARNCQRLPGRPIFTLLHAGVRSGSGQPLIDTFSNVNR
ncbi:DNA cytosine methyltransferase [Pseudorhodoplanes sinuspersici]|uniref:DNA cytosine methyltransferase n=1 Tax=Pseudorhodoplanes sinuspersici TaxID=1235591 RepID=UPI000E74770B|nr:DNA cytosine methyltransferase [Pseudorhodoplanes sinuspersici]